jgi:Gpi18-like mannosyltransferase
MRVVGLLRPTKSRCMSDSLRSFRKLITSLQLNLRDTRVLSSIGVLLGLGLAVLVRVPLLNFESVDFFNERIQMYPLIKQQGFAALANATSNYNPPYFYALYVIARFAPALPMVIAVKLPALMADFVCAFLVYLIVKLKFVKGPTPLWAALAVLFAPSVVANSAFWGQVDSMHTAGILACIYFLLKRQNFWAVLAFAVALTIKLQSIFLAPLLFALFLRGEISWKVFLLVPGVLFLALIPAWIAGRPLLELLSIYLNQASEFELLTMNAASIYTWVPATKQLFEALYFPSLIMGAAVAFLLVTVIYKGPKRITPPLLLELTLLTMLVLPFFLPKMHDRYFFPADVISIAFVMYYPQFFYVPLIVIAASSLSYLPYLFEVEPVPIPFLTVLLLMVICVLTYHSIRQLYSPADNTEARKTVMPGEVDNPGARKHLGETV